MVKQLPNWLKIGLQSQFGPNFVAEFEAFFRKKNWPGLMYNALRHSYQLEHVFYMELESTIAKMSDAQICKMTFLTFTFNKLTLEYHDS